MSYTLVHQNCLGRFRQQPPNSIHAVCTDPPYGVVEFTDTDKELGKLRAGRGGVWRIPPNLNGSLRAPLPRFTVLSAEQQKAIAQFFQDGGGKSAV
jgi:tRNA G10  N-methylase Trm11